MIALLVTSLVPLVVAIRLADSIITSMSDIAFNPELGDYMDHSLGLYADLVKSMKQAMRAEGEAIAAAPSLRSAAGEGDEQALGRELDQVIAGRSGLYSLGVEGADGTLLVKRQREAPLDEARERPFEVRQPLDDGEEAPLLVATFAADRTRLDEMASAQEMVQAWHAMATKQRADIEGGGPIRRLADRAYLASHALLFVLTVLLAMITAVLVVRPIIRRINELASVTRPVAEGDLSVRVEVTGRDEIADLGHAFNRMLETLDANRARIEFLKRVGEWQNMARRLAHEIKNPLTPIQLAVEECRQRYDGDDRGFRSMLDTTHDIVVEEVASLRRLVGEFSEFARLPRAALQPGDLGEFLRDEEPRLSLDSLGRAEPEWTLNLEDEPMPVALDRTMLYRVLSNLTANAAQAAAEKDKPVVRVSARKQGSECVLEVEDNGPGIPLRLRQSIFDPYVTTKKEGTGLGLTIVKKVIIDHGGSIEVDSSSLGGATFRVRLPLLGTAASDVAMAQSEAAPLSG